MSSGRPLGEEAKNGAGTLPAYKKITPEELDKYNIPATVQKYFGPRGLLTALLLIRDDNAQCSIRFSGRISWAIPWATPPPR